MSRQSASKWLRGYMNLNQICLPQVSKDLGIPVERLSVECAEALSSDEFLSLCAYFDLDLDRFVKEGY